MMKKLGILFLILSFAAGCSAGIRLNDGAAQQESPPEGKIGGDVPGVPEIPTPPQNSSSGLIIKGTVELPSR